MDQQTRQQELDQYKAIVSQLYHTDTYIQCTDERCVLSVYLQQWTRHIKGYEVEYTVPKYLPVRITDHITKVHPEIYRHTKGSIKFLTPSCGTKDCKFEKEFKEIFPFLKFTKGYACYDTTNPRKQPTEALFDHMEDHHGLCDTRLATDSGRFLCSKVVLSSNLSY